MAASFASRLSGLRQKKITSSEQCTPEVIQNKDNSDQLFLLTKPTNRVMSRQPPSPTHELPSDYSKVELIKVSPPKNSVHILFKTEMASSNNIGDSKPLAQTQKLSLYDQPKGQMKLTLYDQPGLEEKKSLNQPPKIPLQKRILIAKEPPKEQPKREQPPIRQEPKRQQPPLPPRMEKQGSRQLINAHQEKPIQEEAAQQSLPPQSQNDLVMCPQGCGRKFNRKALEKHAKACKLVFMSKRKQFNSEAKRISKQSAAITKQTKIEEKKKMGMTKGKGFDKNKTGDNWKAASEDFRSAVKAMKKEQKPEEDGEGEVEAEVDIENQPVKIVTVLCQYCQKQFNEVFIDKHMVNCVKKKQYDRSKDKKKTTKKM